MVGWSFMFDRDDNWLMKRFYKSRVLDLSSQILDSGILGELPLTTRTCIGWASPSRAKLLLI
jgi:hypothetical protein